MSHLPRNQSPTRATQVGAVPGFQPKVCALFVDGMAMESIPGHVATVSQEVLDELVVQLDGYCHRQLGKTPAMDVQKLQAHIRRELWGRCRDLSMTELDWVMGTLVERMGWRLPNTADPLGAGGMSFSPCGATILELSPEEAARLVALEYRPQTRVKSVVDVAIETLAARLGTLECL